MNEAIAIKLVVATNYLSVRVLEFKRTRFYKALSDDRGDVPGWVLVVLMTVDNRCTSPYCDSKEFSRCNEWHSLVEAQVPKEITQG